MNFDANEAEYWLLPRQPQAREYQKQIAQSALFQNTLVCLPTGLGKTLIAAIVMANYIRWFPQGIVIFTAPTRPLVSQQIEACRKLMHIPSKFTWELTGRNTIEERERTWNNRGIFFATPQVIENDITRGLCPKHRIVCIIFDECHRAVGKHSYASVSQHLKKEGLSFRCIGLSATPGADRARLQEVVTNLAISKIEFRSEEDQEIKAHTHYRGVEKVLVKGNESVVYCKQTLHSLMHGLLSDLCACGVYWTADVSKSSRATIMHAIKRLDQMPALSPSSYLSREEISLHMKQLISLYSVCDQLEEYGIGEAFSYVQMELGKAMSPLSKLNGGNETFHQFLIMIKSLAKQRADDPKVGYLRKVLQDHFHAHCIEGVTRNVIVFTNHRAKVHDIVSILQERNENCPNEIILKPAAFIGQAQGRGKAAGMKQEEQQRVLRKFREGHYNILVATCVAEEGLDIPEVSLIVCYDPSVSPGRNIQRMGRTGRKEEGKVIYLLNDGKENEDYENTLKSTKKLQTALKSGGEFLNLRPSMRLVPHRYAPKPRLMDIQSDTLKSENKVEIAQRSEVPNLWETSKKVKVDHLMSHQEVLEAKTQEHTRSVDLDIINSFLEVVSP